MRYGLVRNIIVGLKRNYKRNLTRSTEIEQTLTKKHIMQKIDFLTLKTPKPGQF